jgi:hypothetical protein
MPSDAELGSGGAYRIKSRVLMFALHFEANWDAMLVMSCTYGRIRVGAVRIYCLALWLDSSTGVGMPSLNRQCVVLMAVVVGSTVGESMTVHTWPIPGPSKWRNRHQLCFQRWLSQSVDLTIIVNTLTVFVWFMTVSL